MKRKIFIILLIFCTLLANSYTFAEELPSENDISIYKVWTVLFNQPIDVYSIYYDNIYIEDEEGNRMPISFEIYPNNLNKLNIYAEELYRPSTEYTLQITNNVTSLDGKGLKDEVIKKFQTKAVEKELLVDDQEGINEISVGGNFYIRLRSFIDTWMSPTCSVIISDESIIQLDSNEYEYVSENPMKPFIDEEGNIDGDGGAIACGAYGDHAWYFQGLKEGDCIVTIKYESDYEYDNGTYEYHIKVINKEND
ncbi:Ig-like domain-containing protein [Wukongibacter sp. M2B1]|uniref:Ig-like domain-containing protein n=1 Tax=Wukongibacter sp. M2B1 TaxID=3088895 RepID=UPI003D79770B